MELEKYLAKPNQSLAEHTKRVAEQAQILFKLKYISKPIYDLLAEASEYHDYGKANAMFQQRIKSGKRFDEEKEVPHNILSIYFINKEEFNKVEDYVCILYAVLNHHSYCNNYEYICDLSNKEKIDKSLEGFNTFKLTSRTLSKLKIKNITNKWICVKGLLHKCDYSASAGIPIEYPPIFLEQQLNNMMHRWQEKNPSARFNELQEFCFKNTENNVIVVAQTGMGKTEAALAWIGDNKGFFILPLKAAINAIYSRICKDVLVNERVEERIALIHSDTLSNYANEQEHQLTFLDYYQRSRQLSLPLNITTPDQVFKFVYKYNGYELLLATLGYSKIVIDEIQMYDADLLAYLIYGVKKFTEFGGKFAILTATLAPFIKDLLRKEFSGELCWEEGIFVNDLKRHNIKTSNQSMNAEDIYKQYSKKQSSNKILVVCNTIKKAQQVYETLKKYEVDNINLLHSKFIKKDRSRKEEDILDFGKTYNDNGDINQQRGIWVSTQIVEASLDIDFDYLFTELSDINGLFQRLGRCNRKGVKSIQDYNCFVYTKINKNILKNGDRGFIDKQMYNLSCQALENVDGILSEQEKLSLINTYFTMDNIKNSDYYRTYKNMYQYITQLYTGEIDKKNVAQRFRNILSYVAIPESVYKENETYIQSQLEIIKDKEKEKRKQIQSKDAIDQFTLQVGHYDVYPNRYINNIVETIEIGKNEKILVIKGDYTDMGFQKYKNFKEIDDSNVFM